MPNYRRIATRKARKYGIDPRYFRRQIGAESGFNPNARSPAGARGIAQIMPATAQGWGVNPDDPIAALDAAAKNMAGYLRDYKGDWRLALAAYNAGPGAVQQHGGVPPYAETQNYIKKILGGGNPRQSSRARANSTSTTTKSIPGIDNSQLRQQLALQYIENRDRPDAALNFGLALKEAQDVPGSLTTTTTRRPIGKQAGGQRIRKDGWKGSKSAGGSLASLAKNHGLTVTSTKRETQNTASGGVSDHFSGNRDSFAWDLGGSVGGMDAAARGIAAKLGVKNWKGGVLNVNKTIDGRQYRFQVLYRTNVGGNHYDHIHVGVDRLDTPG